MIIVFKLSMPNCGSWNGKWTGSENLYARTKNLGRTQIAQKKGEKLISESSYYYNFGDGWSASISIEEVDAKKAAKFRKASKGFCGYDWMIESILSCGEIKC